MLAQSQAAGNDTAIMRTRRRQAMLERADALKKKLAREIPPLFAKAHIRHIPAALRSFLFQRERSQGLLLWGPAGVGKSFTLAALSRFFLLRGARVKRVVHADLLLRLMATFADRSKSEIDVLRPYREADILILDDVGTARSGTPESDYSRKSLENLIDYRLEQMKPTFISSNLCLENLEAAFGQRAGSRLHTFMVLHCAGQDKRKK